MLAAREIQIKTGATITSNAAVPFSASVTHSVSPASDEKVDRGWDGREFTTPTGGGGVTCHGFG